MCIEETFKCADPLSFSSKDKRVKIDNNGLQEIKKESKKESKQAREKARKRERQKERKTERNKQTKQERKRQGKTSQDKITQDKTRKDKPRHGKTSVTGHLAEKGWLTVHFLYPYCSLPAFYWSTRRVAQW